MLESVLQNAGLSDKEARIYLALLELKEAFPSSIAHRANVKRPTTYVVLKQLEKKGFVSRGKKKNGFYYRALHPELLLEREQRKCRDIEEALPDLMNLHHKFGIVPQMSVHEGKEGLIDIMEDTLTTKTELLCWADVALAVDSLRDYYPTYIEKKVKKKLWLRGVFTESKQARRFKKYGKEELREIYIIPKEKYPFKNEINIYDDKIAIISHEDQVGVIIQNANMADTQRSIFQLGFEYAQILESKNAS